jgi:molybdate transport system substrate-binding protein
MRLRSAVLLWVVLAVSALPAGAAEIRVLAAASLREAMDDQARRFEAASGDKVVVSYGASNALAKQIEAGSPADLFISADLDWMDYVDTRHLLAPGTRVDLLRNRLVLIAPAANPVRLDIAPGFALAQALDSGKLAMANPDSVPAGKYGKQSVVTLGVWISVEARVARAENVRAALVLVARGEAPLGIVYNTDAMAEPGIKVVGTLPASSHPPIVYPAAVLASSKSSAAVTLLAALRSPQARAGWEKYGFGVVQ